MVCRTFVSYHRKLQRKRIKDAFSKNVFMQILKEFVSIQLEYSVDQCANKFSAISQSGNLRDNALKSFFIVNIHRQIRLIINHAVVNLVTALVPSETACFANSPGSMSRTDVWISRLERVAF